MADSRDDEYTGVRMMWDSYPVTMAPTQFRVRCKTHGKMFLTQEEYDHQVALGHEVLVCPYCHEGEVDTLRFWNHINARMN